MRVVRAGDGVAATPDDVAQAEARARIEASLRERGELLPWHTIGDVGEPGFRNGYSAWSGWPVQFRKHHFGWVEMRGRAQTSNTGYLAIAELPVGFRPAVNMQLPAIWRAASGTQLGQFLIVQADGLFGGGEAGQVTSLYVLDQALFATDS